jgi:nucleoside-triphosphatase THEP1
MTHWIVLAGEIGSGKTTALLKALDLLEVRGVRCLGVFGRPALDAAGRRLGVDVIELESGHRRRLARWVGKAGQVCPAYEFDAHAFAWARASLRNSIASRPELLVIDEIGPLELRHHRGYARVFEEALRADLASGLVVVREPLLAPLLERLFGHEVRVLHLTLDNRDAIPAQIDQAVVAACRRTVP